MRATTFIIKTPAEAAIYAEDGYGGVLLLNMQAETFISTANATLTLKQVSHSKKHSRNYSTFSTKITAPTLQTGGLLVLISLTTQQDLPTAHTAMTTIAGITA